MSTTIENQVVSMQFDNKHFESNVRTSMGTIEKLKHSLKFHDASKGFDDLNKAAKKTDLSPLAKATETIGLKFNAMYTMADQALRNITTRVQHCAESIVKSFTIDPIKTGFSEYETQINAVQTILANTQSKGTTLDDVNMALDELNKYADKTIYNFTEMTRNIGTFTAAGVDLDTSVNAIQGIANLAAISGSNAQQASTAMYQLSQALSSGTVKLMDWNSVVNAGMGGQVFQDALKETARAHGIAIDDMIEKNGSFRETLQEGWLTSEILTETLQKFTMTTEGLTEAQIEQNRAMLKSKGYTDEQIDEIFKLGETATDAATKVKTFSQLMDTLKEAAQSGWTQTWELLVGDFEEAKELWTNISNIFGDMINSSSESRNALLEGALTSNWDKMIKQLETAGVTTEKFEDTLTKTLKENGYDVDKLIKGYGSLEKVFQSGAVSADILGDAIRGITGSKGDFNLDNINRTISNGMSGDDVKEVEKALKSLGYNLVGKDGKDYSDDGYFGTITREAIKEFQKAQGLKITGIVDEETLAALQEATSTTVELNDSIFDVIDGVTQLGGRELIIESFMNLLEGFKNVIAPIGEAFREIFPPTTSEQLYSLLDGFHELTRDFKLWTYTAPGKKTLEDLKNTFKGIFSIVKLVGKVIGGLGKGFLEIFGKIFKTAGTDVLTFTGNIGDSITKFVEWLEGSGELSKWIDGVVKDFGDGLEKIRGWIDSFLASPEVQQGIEDFKAGFSDIGESLKSNFGKFGESFNAFIERVKSMDGLSLENIKAAFVDFYNNVLKPIWTKEDGTSIFDGLINSIKKLWEGAKKFLESTGIKFEEFGEGISGFFSSIKEWIGGNAGGLIALGSLLAIFLSFKKIGKLAGSIIEPIASFAGSFKDVADSLSEGIQKVSKGLSMKFKAEAVKSIAIAIGILAASIVALTLVDPAKLAGAVAALVVAIAALGGLMVVMNKFSGNLGDLTKLAGSILAISGALLVFAISAKIVASVDGSDLVKTGAIIVGFLLLAKSLSKAASGGSGAAMEGFGVMMLKLSAGLLVLGIAVGILGRMNTETLLKGGAAVGVFLLMMAGMMKATRNLEKDTPRFAASMAGLSASILILSAATGILGNMKTETLIKGIAAIGVFLLMMAGMMKATKLLDKDMPRFGATMIGLSTGLLAMAFTVKIIAGISGEDLVKGGVVIAAFLAMMAGMMAATKLLSKQSKNAAKVGVMMLSFAAAMIMLTGVIAILAMIEPADLAKATLAIGAVGGIFAGMIALTKFAKVGKGIKTTILTMAVTIGILAVALAALSFVDPAKLAGASTALSLVMGMFAVMTASTKLISAKSIGTLLVLTGVVAILAGIIYLLSDIPADGALKVAGALSALILSLSASALMLSVIGLIGPAAFIGVGVLAALMAVIAIFAGIALASLPAIGNQLSEFMDNLSGFLDGASKITPEVSNGIKNLADSILILTTAGILDSIMFGSPIGNLAKQMKPLGKGISEFAESVGDSDIDSKKVTAAIDAATALTSLSTALADTSWISKIMDEDNLDTFGGQLGAFGIGLAEFSTAISDKTFDADKITEAVTAAEGLVGLSTALADTSWISQLTNAGDLGEFGGQLIGFGLGLASFSAAVSDKEFDAKKVKDASDAASGLVGLSTTLSNTSWISQLIGAGDLNAFGSQLIGFGLGLASFSAAVSDKEFNAKKVKDAADAATGLVGLSTTLSDASWIGQLTGAGDLSKFGSQLTGFGLGLAAFSAAVSDKEFDVKKIKSAADAATGLVGLSTTLSDASWIGQLTGAGDLSKFGYQLTGFGLGLAAFSSAVSDQEFNTKKIKSAADAATGLVGLSTALADASWISQLTGAGDLGEFGVKLACFGIGLAAFSSAVSDKEFNAEKVKSAADAATGLVGLSTALADTNWITALLGLNDLGSFGTQLEGFGKGLAAFSKSVSSDEFNADSIATAVSAAEGLANLAGIVGENSAGWEWLTGKDGLDTFGQKIETFGDKLAAFCSKVSGDGFDSAAVSAAISQVESFVNMATTLSTNGVGNSLSEFGYQIEDVGSNVGLFYDAIKDVDATKFSKVAVGIQALASVKVSDATTLQSFINSLGEVSADGVDKFAKSFQDAGPKVLVAVSIMMQLTKIAILTKGMAISEAFSDVVKKSLSAASNPFMYIKFVAAGGHLAQGFAAGIQANSFMAAARAKAMALGALAAAKLVLKINSPSKAFMKVGESVPEGFSMGIDKMSKLVTGSSESMADDAIDGTKNAISRLADMVNLDIDSQPTIRPILDLSDVESGVGAIDGMFGMQPSVGLMSNIGSINSAMTNRQNGGNSDVISAINKLGSQLGKTSGNVYNVNGVTYDDGSNISNAVKSLVRAAKVERRI